MARRFAALVPFYEYDEHAVLPRRRGARGGRRRAARRLHAAGGHIRASGSRKRPPSAAKSRGGVSDLQFTARYRVPFQFSRMRARSTSRPASFLESSAGITVTDLDGNRLYDLTGSYGVNRVRLRLLQGVHRAGQRAGARPGSGARRLSSGRWPTTCGGCARFPGWMKSPFTCRAPRPSCRRCASRATTPGATSWCASAGPTMAGGATCSPAWAIRWRRAKPTR